MKQKDLYCDGNNSDFREIYKAVERKILRLSSRKNVHIPWEGIHFNILQSGSGTEIREITEFQLGDNCEHICWTKMVYPGKFYVKRFNSERKRKIILAVDGSSSMGLFNKNRVAVSIIIFLSLITIKQEDLIEIIVFTDDVKKIYPKTSQKNKILQRLMKINDIKRENITNLYQSLKKINSLTHKDDILFIISDFIDTDSALTENWTELLRGMSRYKETIPIVIRGDNLPPPNCGLIRYSNVESGEEFFIDSSKIPPGRPSPVENFFKEAGINCVIADLQEDYIEKLIKHLLRYQRQKR